jgi:hypothetical protein
VTAIDGKTLSLFIPATTTTTTSQEYKYLKVLLVPYHPAALNKKNKGVVYAGIQQDLSPPR